MIDRIRAARAIEDFLLALGHDLEGDLEGTGARVADAWADDLLSGESIDAAALLRDGAIPCDPDTAGLVIVRGLSISTMCPHHLLPGHGTALVAYVPSDRAAGIGRIAHVVDALARRLTIQERIGAAVVDLLVRELGARGALCKLTLMHTCLIARGERQGAAIVDTLDVAGTFATSGADRDLALAAIGRG